MFIAFFFMSFKLGIPLITVNLFFLICCILYNILNSISYFGVIFIFRNLITTLLSEDEERGRKWLSNRILSGYKFSQVHSQSFIEDNFYLWMAVLSGKSTLMEKSNKMNIKGKLYLHIKVKGLRTK